MTAVKDTGVFTPVYLEDKLCIFARLDRLGIPVVSFKIQFRVNSAYSLSSLAWLKRLWGGGNGVGRCHSRCVPGRNRKSTNDIQKVKCDGSEVPPLSLAYLGHPELPKWTPPQLTNGFPKGNSEKGAIG